MYDYERGWDETQEHLSHEVHVTRHHKKDEDYALSVRAHRLCNLRM